MSAPTETVPNTTSVYEIGDKVVAVQHIEGRDYAEDKCLDRNKVVTMDPGKVLTIVDKSPSYDRRTSVSPDIEYVYRLGYEYGASRPRTVYVQDMEKGPKLEFPTVAHTTLQAVHRINPDPKELLYKNGDAVRLENVASFPLKGGKVEAPAGSLMVVKGAASTLNGGQHAHIRPKNAYYRLVHAKPVTVYDVYWKSSRPEYESDFKSDN